MLLAARDDSLVYRGAGRGLSATIEVMISPDLLEILACPVCRKPLVLRGEESLKCNECKRVYPIRNGIPILLEPEATIEQL
jgi:LSD1 subclass zinc finger protein